MRTRSKVPAAKDGRATMPETAWATHVLLALCTAFVPVVLPQPAESQSVVDLAQFATCETCVLRIEPYLPLAWRQPDLIESEAAWATFDPFRRRYLLVAGPSVIAFFDSAGNYLGRIDRPGRGPGEFRMIRDVEAGRHGVVVMDVGAGRWTLLDADGNYVGTAPLERVGTRFVLLDEDRSIVAATSAPIGSHTMFVTRLATGAETGAFGGTAERLNTTVAWANQTLVSRGEGGTIWSAARGELRFHQWSRSGSLLQTVSGTPAWFPPVRALPDETERPPTRLNDFAVDSAGRLWTLTWVATPKWRDALRSARRTPDGERFTNPEDYFATRLDIYDLRRRVHYGSVSMGAANVRLLDRGGEILLQYVTYTAAANPYITLARVMLDAVNTSN